MATASPTCRTLPEASGGKAEYWYVGSEEGEPMSAASSIISRRNTFPAIASGISTPVMVACARGLRRNATSCRPGNTKSPTKLPLPTMWRASSLRGTRAPMPSRLSTLAGMSAWFMRFLLLD
ncbi:hypothetical protein D3C71_1448520 [compost metagenome]